MKKHIGQMPLNGCTLKIHTLDIAPGLRASAAAVADAAALAQLIQQNVPHLQTYLPAVASLASPADAESHLRRLVAAIGRGELLEWHLFADDALCGAIRLNNIEKENRKVSVAYYIGSAYQGKGIATSAVRSVLGYCFATLGINRVELRCVTTNVPSIRVAERLGFAREGMLRQAEMLDGSFADHYVYGLLREDFMAARQPIRADGAAA